MPSPPPPLLPQAAGASAMSPKRTIPTAWAAPFMIGSLRYLVIMSLLYMMFASFPFSPHIVNRFISGQVPPVPFSKRYSTSNTYLTRPLGV